MSCCWCYSRCCCLLLLLLSLLRLLLLLMFFPLVPLAKCVELPMHPIHLFITLRTHVSGMASVHYLAFPMCQYIDTHVNVHVLSTISLSVMCICECFCLPVTCQRQLTALSCTVRFSLIVLRIAYTTREL